MNRYHVGLCYNLVQRTVCQVQGPLHLGRQSIHIVVDQARAERLRPPGHLLANPPHPDDAERLSPELEYSIQRHLILRPLGPFGLLVSQQQLLQAGEYEHERVLGHRKGVGSGNVGHGDAFSGSGINVDMLISGGWLLDEDAALGRPHDVGVHGDVVGVVADDDVGLSHRLDKVGLGRALVGGYQHAFEFAGTHFAGDEHLGRIFGQRRENEHFLLLSCRPPFGWNDRLRVVSTGWP